jgi:hypothetical protein
VLKAVRSCSQPFEPAFISGSVGGRSLRVWVEEKAQDQDASCRGVGSVPRARWGAPRPPSRWDIWPIGGEFPIHGGERTLLTRNRKPVMSPADSPGSAHPRGQPLARQGGRKRGPRIWRDLHFTVCRTKLPQEITSLINSVRRCCFKCAAKKS